jgi:glutathione S-transferase
MVRADGSVCDAGTIIESDPPRRLVIRWQHQDQPDLKAEGESRCTIELQPDGTAVKLSITHTMEREPSKLITAVSGGWPKIISNLKSLLETGSVALEQKQPSYRSNYNVGGKLSSFIVYTVPGSPFARAVLATLEEKAVPYRIVALKPGEHRAPDHLSRHPFGRMPVIEHGDFRLYETQAIMRYIDRVVAEPALSPTDPCRLARMDQLININDWYLFQGCANVIVFNRVVGPRLLGLKPDEAAIAQAVPRAQVVLQELAWLLGDQAYFGGEQVTLADLVIAPQLDLFAEAPEWGDLKVTAGPLHRWLERMRGRPSMQNTTWERVAAAASGDLEVRP